VTPPLSSITELTEIKINGVKAADMGKPHQELSQVVPGYVYLAFGGPSTLVVTVTVTKKDPASAAYYGSSANMNGSRELRVD
jgi:hypothetical protein